MSLSSPEPDASAGAEASASFDSGILLRPIGVVRSEHTVPVQTPIQPQYAAACKGRLEIKPEFVDGLKDLDGFSHLILLYYFHQAVHDELKMQIVPFTDTKARGLFSTRYPRRPNPIGLSIVRLERVEENVVHISEVDILDRTPLLDIKPLIPRFDLRPEILQTARGGWSETVSDAFADKQGVRDYRRSSQDGGQDVEIGKVGEQ